MLKELNEGLFSAHEVYESFYWTSYMGDHSVDKDMLTALKMLDAFRADRKLSALVDDALATAKGTMCEKLLLWRTFFACYQVPEKFLALRIRIS